LSEVFFQSAVQPIIKEAFPHLEYSAARLDYGSDVLRFDTPMSMDHGWGPKLTLYLSEKQHKIYREQLDQYFANHLPFEILGFPTNFGEPLSDGGVMAYKDNYPIHHMITITTPEKWFSEYLGADITQPLSPKVWLTIPQQRLATLQKGRIFYDGLGMLGEVRRWFGWYPQDIWYYLLANQWKRIDQDEPFIGRTGSVGDELGSKLIAARLLQDLMRLGFLIEKTYIPYRKWFGSAFRHLSISDKVLPIFNDILTCKDWCDREKHLSKAYLLFAEEHNKLGITPEIKPEITNFHNRPFRVPHSARFADALHSQIEDPEVKALPPYFGSVDQICDNTDILENIDQTRKFKTLYE
jgi:hypothetical protein